jgi:crotonobetainyl-CoA:carnitine CoA-transferase CaiB-like acyl-CoA transferase
MTVLDQPALGASILTGCVVSESDRAPLPIRIAGRHLRALGATRSGDLAGEAPHSDLLVAQSSAGRTESLRCSLAAWDDTQLDDERSGEAIVQAISGLMAVHGRDRGRPRRLGLDVASTAAGILAASGVLAALIAQARGGVRVRAVGTSLLHGALAYLGHHVAIATCGKRLPVACNPPATAEDEWLPPAPPFPTADGHRVELEVLSADAWRAFWSKMGVDGADADGAWPPFALRYLAGTCRLPPAFASATSRYDGEDIVQIARSCGLSAAFVRRYDELLRDVVGDRGSSGGSGGLPELDSPWAIRPGAPRAYARSGRDVQGEAPLAGLRVIEATTRLQGPLATRLLQLLGAEVIRIEPIGGDIGRTAPGAAFRAAYSAYNRGKQVIELDYKQPGGRAGLLELISGADVFLHNWPDARAERLGLDAASLSAVNPAIVYTHASGWGSGHPGHGSITGDFLVQAHAACGEGLHALGDPALPSRLTIVDVLGGLIACEGTLGALYQRETRYSGAAVETSLLAAALTLQSEILCAIASGRESGRRHGRPISSRFYEPVQTGDGHVFVAADRPDRADRAMEAFGLPVDGHLDDQLLANRLCSKSAAEWVSDLQAAGVPAAVVCTDLSAIATDGRTASCVERAEPGNLVPARPWRFIG